jgi:hypothetical protein
VLAPLTTDDALLDEGLDALEAALEAATAHGTAPTPSTRRSGRAPSTN